MQIPPELFTLAGVGLFLMLSLSTYFGENRFPRKLPYIYQIAAFSGFLLLVVSKFILPHMEEFIRLWYCYGYLLAALTNVLGANIYLAVPKRQHTISRIWSLAITFPSVLASTYFAVQYGLAQSATVSSIEQITVVAFGIAIAICAGTVVFQRISHARLSSSAHQEVTK
jgi:hypothetical protein